MSGRRVFRIVLGSLAALFVAAQFVRPERNISATPPGSQDFIVKFSPPPALAERLRTSCYDCHSDNTRYPWYANLQPTGWWLQKHVNDGKRALNFSQFGNYSSSRQGKKIEEMLDELTFHTMPLKSYTWIHRSAKLTEKETAELTAWLENVSDELE